MYDRNIIDDHIANECEHQREEGQAKQAEKKTRKWVFIIYTNSKQTRDKRENKQNTKKSKSILLINEIKLQKSLIVELLNEYE